MSESTCYYYDEQRHRCNCYVNENLNELLAENAKLHDELAKWERLSAGIDLPDYPVTQFKPKDLERENAKLREELADVPKCETCEAMLDCDECLRADVSHKERRRLSAENAKLRQEIEVVGTVAYVHGVKQLKAENARLRELAARAWLLFMKHGAVHQSDLPEVDAVRDGLRELGVEADA